MTTALRDKNVAALGDGPLDVLIVGGGINGAVSAAALASRGARVGLIDARDFAGLTSQHSSNLVWGGIKYMEGYEFGLVAELCRARNLLLDSFPSTVKEIRFFMTLNRNFRFHPLVLYASTWLYWLLGRGRTRIPRFLRRERIRREEPLVNQALASSGIVYSDAFLHDNDARFVFNFIRAAMKRGCRAANYVEAKRSRRDATGLWTTQAIDAVTGREFTIRSKVLINAGGAYADAYNGACGVTTEHRHRLSKGVHLVVPRLSEHHRVLAFFADDERLFFAIPMANRTCIGTTDTIVDDPEAGVSDADRAFILANINARLDLAQPLTASDVIAERCGVRPLAVTKTLVDGFDDKNLSRRHVLETNAESKHITIFGGKLTDCLNVGEDVVTLVRRLGVRLDHSAEQWFGEPGDDVRERFMARARALGLERLFALDTGESLAARLWRRYGDEAFAMLHRISDDRRLAEPLIEGLGVCRCEVEHLAETEMIVHLEDYLRRRSKIELVVPRDRLRRSPGLVEACRILFADEATQKLDEYFAAGDQRA